MQFLKEHLTGHYAWPQEASINLFTGTPTRRIFDRQNGNQVLFLINAAAILFANFSIEQGRALEKMISDNLSLQTQSELSVFSWLRSQGVAF